MKNKYENRLKVVRNEPYILNAAHPNSQVSHLCGRSSECLLCKWSVNELFTVNALPHSSHTQFDSFGAEAI